MRWVSSKESVANGEVSALAIIETLLAITLVFFLSLRFNTLRWLSVAMFVSPLLLLRTEKSTALGIKWFDLVVKGIIKPLLNLTIRYRRRSGLVAYSIFILFLHLFGIAFAAVISLGALSIRIGVTVWS